MGPIEIPNELLLGARSEGRTEWLERLPAVLSELSHEWHLHLDAPFRPGGWTAWVAPARDGRGRDVVLKVVWAHLEAAREAAGLRLWDGRGAVRLFEEATGPDWNALLLERCRPGHLLRELPEDEQDLVIAGLLHRLAFEPGDEGGFRSLKQMCEAWADEAEESRGQSPGLLDESIVRAGLEMLRTLADEAPTSRLLCTDLHAGNVLAAEREPFLMIDPKPHLGDPNYDVVQHLLNCPGRLQFSPLALVARIAGLADLDAGRVRAWTFARCVQESLGRESLGHLSGKRWVADVARMIAP